VRLSTSYQIVSAMTLCDVQGVCVVRICMLCYTAPPSATGLAGDGCSDIVGEYNII